MMARPPCPSLVPSRTCHVLRLHSEDCGACAAGGEVGHFRQAEQVEQMRGLGVSG